MDLIFYPIMTLKLIFWNGAVFLQNFHFILLGGLKEVTRF